MTRFILEGLKSLPRDVIQWQSFCLGVQGPRFWYLPNPKDNKSSSVLRVEQSFNPNTQEAEVGTALGVWGQPGLYSEFQDNQSYVERPCLIKIKKKK